MFETWDVGDVISVSLICGVIVALVVIIGFAMRTSWVESECLSKGFREGRVDFRGRGYCVTRTDQPDRVVPLRELR